MTTHPETRRFSRWAWVVFGALTVIVAILVLYPPLKMRGGPGHDFVRAINNMKQIGLALHMFEADFGRMPDDTTVKILQERYPDNLIPMGGISSNDYFHQLFVGAIVDDPSIFYGRGIATHRPFDWVDGQPPLPPGTCGFSYILPDQDSMPRSRPLVVYPLKRDLTVFDIRLFKTHPLHTGRNPAAVLSADLSVSEHILDRRGRLFIGGRDFFDPAQPHWNGCPFRVAWPE